MRPPPPPFTDKSAIEKIRLAEDGWNGRNPEKVALAYTPDSVWRNRNLFLASRDEIIAFLTEKRGKENGYRLITELFAFTEDRIAVRYAYEFHDDDCQWFRAYGNENWIFAPNGLMAPSHASINNLTISNADRLFHWPQGRRPDDHPGLTELGL